MGAAAGSDASFAIANPASIHLAGTGSFALEVLEYARAAGREVVGLIELLDRSRVGTMIHEVRVTGPERRPQNGWAVVALSRNRLALWRELEGYGWRAASIIHPSAVLSSSSSVGPGAVIGPLAVLGGAATLDEQCLVGRGALIGHHVRLGAGVIVNPGANLGGNTQVGEGAVIGMGASVVNELRIGAGARVAAGAVVVRDVPDGARVQGVPARVYTREASLA